MDILYERIKQCRIEKGLSQEELAELTGYKGRSAISYIERGKVNLQANQIHRFADALGVSVAYLMNLEEDDTTPYRVQWEYLGNIWESLNKEGMDALISYAELLTANKKYLK